MPKQKTVVPQGSNSLSVTIEKIMKEFGGIKYKSYSAKQFLDIVNNELDEAIKSSKGAVQVIGANLKRKLARRKTVEEMLLDLNETLFSFFEGEK